MKKKVLLVLALVLVLLAGLGIKLYTDNYVLVAGNSISRDAQAVDLRDSELTLEDYAKLRESLPDCEIRWNIPFQGALYDSTTQELTVTTLSAEDAAVLGLFTELTRLDATGCTDYEALMDFRSGNPDCSVIYQVTLGGNSYTHTARNASVENADIQELKTNLAYLPQLTRLHLSGQLPEYSQLQELISLYPQIDIRWDVTVEEKKLSSALTSIDLTGMNMDRSRIDELILWLPNLTSVTVRDCGLDNSELMALADDYPELLFIWDMPFYDFLLPTDAEEIDISGQVLSDTREIEDLLPYFPNLKKVVMSHCGFDDETMDALNNRYEDIRFVWSIKVQEVYIRTDTKYFYPYKYRASMDVDDEDLIPLRYLIDCECVDIGHMWAVTHCEWVRYMPKLKYFITIDSQISDLSPLANCKELIYLEIFRTPVTDYSPLLNCTKLEDLNLCHTYGDYTVIAQMTWLKTLYWTGIKGTYGLPCSGAHLALPEALPNTTLKFDGHASVWRNGWRLLKNYKDMRDLMDMFYLA